MANIDPCQKLAECEAALQRATDPSARAVLTGLCDMWIELTNHSHLLTPHQLDAEIEAIGRIYALAYPAGAARRKH